MKERAIFVFKMLFNDNDKIYHKSHFRDSRQV